MAVSPVALTINATVTGQQSVQALSQALQQLGLSANALSSSPLAAALAGIATNANTTRTALGSLLPVLSSVGTAGVAGMQQTSGAIRGLGASAVQAAGNVSTLTTSLNQAGAASRGLGNINVGGQSGSLLGLAANVGGIALAYKALETAARSAFGFIAAGIDANAQQESARLGIASLIASLTTVKDAQGNVLKGADALGASYGIADDQLQKLRIAGLETAATYKQLASAYQEAIGAGSSAGLTLEQTRKLTVGITQAATALNLPMHQINQEIRAILQGQIDRNARVGLALNLSKEEIALWKQKGVLFEQVSKKLEIFNLAGAEAAKTWRAALSNFQDALQILAGASTEGMFDELKKGLNDALHGLFNLKDASIDKSLQPLVAELDKINTAVGHELAAGILNVVEGVKELSTWIHENQSSVDGLTQSFGWVWNVIKKMLEVIGSFVASTGAAATKAGLLETVFRSIAIVGATLIDGVNLLGAAIVTAGGYVTSALAVPMASVLGLIKTMLNLIPGTSNLGNRLVGNGDQASILEKSGEKNKQALADKIRDLANGNSEVERLINTIDTQITASTDKRAKASPGATSTPIKKDAAAKKTGKTSADADFKADLATERAELQSHYEILKADLEKSLSERHLSQVEYIEKKKALDLQQLEDQKAILLKEKAAAEAAIAKPGITPAERQRLTNDIKKINADIATTLDKEQLVKIKAEIDVDKLNESIAKLRASLNSETFELKGLTLDAQKTKIAEELRERLADPLIQGDPGLQKQVTDNARLKVQKAEFENLKVEADRAIQDARDDVEDLLRLQKTGQLTKEEVAARTKIINAEAASGIKTQIDAMRELVSESPKMLKELDKLENKYKDLSLNVNQFGKQVGESVGKGFETAVKGLQDGSVHGLSGVFKSILGSVAQDLQNDSAKKLGESISKGIKDAIGGEGEDGLSGIFSGLFKKIFSGLGFGAGGSGGGGGGGIGGFIASLFMAEGGIAEGPGTETSDSIPTMLSRGEGVLTARAVKMLGADTVHMLNAKAKGFATGGIIGGQNSSGGLGQWMGQQSKQQQELHVHLTNSLDPTDIVRRADSAVLHKIVLDAANANPTAMRQALGVSR